MRVLLCVHGCVFVFYVWCVCVCARERVCACMLRAHVHVCVRRMCTDASTMILMSQRLRNPLSVIFPTHKETDKDTHEVPKDLRKGLFSLPEKLRIRKRGLRLCSVSSPSQSRATNVWTPLAQSTCVCVCVCVCAHVYVCVCACILSVLYVCVCVCECVCVFMLCVHMYMRSCTCCVCAHMGCVQTCVDTCEVCVCVCARVCLVYLSCTPTNIVKYILSSHAYVCMSSSRF